MTLDVTVTPPQAELNDVLDDDKDEAIDLMEEEEEEEERPKPTRPAPRITPPATSPRSPPATSPSSGGGGGTAGGVEGRLQERIQMYQMAIASAKAAGESSKVRRYDRGLKVRATDQSDCGLKGRAGEEGGASGEPTNQL